jgi:hypothetical protein
VMDRETEGYHLEGISLLAASLAPGVKHVAEVVKVAQVCVSLFYAIDTGSTGSRAHHHVTSWGVPIYTPRWSSDASYADRVSLVSARGPETL